MKARPVARRADPPPHGVIVRVLSTLIESRRAPRRCATQKGPLRLEPLLHRLLPAAPWGCPTWRAPILVPPRRLRTDLEACQASARSLRPQSESLDAAPKKEASSAKPNCPNSTAIGKPSRRRLGTSEDPSGFAKCDPHVWSHASLLLSLTSMIVWKVPSTCQALIGSPTSSERRPCPFGVHVTCVSGCLRALARTKKPGPVSTRPGFLAFSGLLSPLRLPFRHSGSRRILSRYRWTNGTGGLGIRGRLRQHDLGVCCRIDVSGIGLTDKQYPTPRSRRREGRSDPEAGRRRCRCRSRRSSDARDTRAHSQWGAKCCPGSSGRAGRWIGMRRWLS